MIKTMIMELENIIEERPVPAPYTLLDICFRQLPNVQFLPRVVDEIRTLRQRGAKVVLICYGDEVHVKEILYALNACQWFDEIRILDELAKEGMDEMA